MISGSEEHVDPHRSSSPGRSLDSRSSAAGDRRLPRRLRGLRIPQGLSHPQSILRRRSEQSLRRHHQGSHVLRRAPIRRAGARRRRRCTRSSTRFASCSHRSWFSPRKKRGAISRQRRLGPSPIFPEAAGSKLRDSVVQAEIEELLELRGVIGQAIEKARQEKS